MKTDTKTDTKIVNLIIGIFSMMVGFVVMIIGLTLISPSWSELSFENREQINQIKQMEHLAITKIENEYLKEKLKNVEAEAEYKQFQNAVTVDALNDARIDKIIRVLESQKSTDLTEYGSRDKQINYWFSNFKNE